MGFTFKVLFLVCIVSLTGCWQLSYVDASDKKKHQSIIGQKYRVIGKVNAYGIRDGYSGKATKIFVWAGTGFDGPEVSSQKRLEIGTELTITGVYIVNNIPILTCRRALAVKIDDISLPTDIPQIMDLVVKNRGPNCLIPNPEFYERINE